jgi:predicted transcriptional regulator
MTRQDYAGHELESLADTLTAGSFTPLITHLVENKRISTAEINKLRALLDEHSDQ